MAYVSEIFSAAMGLMDELSDTGGAETADTAEYALRTPAVVNMMLSELLLLEGNTSDWAPLVSMDEPVPFVGTSYALGAMPYGLAANLLVDENSRAADFFQQRYEELRSIYLMKKAAVSGEIEELYGGIEHGEAARW